MSNLVLVYLFCQCIGCRDEVRIMYMEKDEIETETERKRDRQTAGERQAGTKRETERDN